MKQNYNNFFKTSDGEQIFYTTNFPHHSITKNVIIFNYGLVCSNHHWSEQIDFFDQLGFPILLHDFRGHFQSSGADDIDKITFEQIAADIKELINHLKLEQSIMFGHSMGVNICLEFAKSHQLDLKAMVLISGSIVPVHDIMMNTHLTGPLKPILLSLLKKFPYEFNAFWKYGGWTTLIQKMIHTGGFNISQVSDEFIEIYLNKIGQLGPELFFQLIDEMQRHDIIAFTSKIKTPTLIIGGNQDKVIPNFLQKLMGSKLENSELYVIHTGSHVPQVDFPMMVNERSLFFLNQLMA